MRPAARLLASTALASLPVVGLVSPAAVTSQAAAAVRAVNGVTLNGFEARLVHDINAARRAHGLRALSVTPGTTDVARRWSHHLATSGVLAHNPSLVAQVARAGSAAWTAIAENVGDGPADAPDELFAAYMASPPHRANILDRSERYLGVGVVQQGDVAWNTLDFTNAYSTRYGGSRVAPAVMSIDAAVPSTAGAVAAGLTPATARIASHARGQVRVSRARVVAGGTAAATSVQALGRRGIGALSLRGPLHLGHATALRLRLAASSRSGAPVFVHVRLLRRLGQPVHVATLRVTASAQSLVVALPRSMRAFYSGVALVVTARQVAAHGGSVRLSAYGARAQS